jgi:hypothetical protein
MALVDVAGLQDLQRGDELCAGELGAPLVGIGQGRQRADDVAHHLVVLQDLAIVRFHRPDGEQDVAVDAVTALDAVEPRLVLARHLAADCHRVLMHAIVEIVPDRGREFGLEAGLLDHFRVWLGDPPEGPIVGAAGNAALGGDRAEARHPLAKSLIGRGRCTHRADQQSETGRRRDDGTPERLDVGNPHGILLKRQTFAHSLTEPVRNEFTMGGFGIINRTGPGHFPGELRMLLQYSSIPA